ncbi:hypothetical protein Tco_0060835 [Tanacetum coccineum]
MLETSNEAKVKNDIDVIETINIELEHRLAKLLAENELLYKENEHLKHTYKDLYDSIKKTRIQTQVNNDSLIAQVNITPHYSPKLRESAFVKPHHVIAPSSSRNSKKESYGSNDMAHNYFTEEVRKKTQEKNSNSKPSVMHTTNLQSITNGSKPKPSSNNQTARCLPVSKSSCVMSIWKAFRVNTRDLGSFEEEMDKTTDLHQHLSRLCSQRLETASQDTRDAVTIHPTTVSQEITTASARTTQPKI